MKRIYLKEKSSNYVFAIDVNDDQNFIDFGGDVVRDNIEITFEQFINAVKINEFKICANKVITDKYPIWKQINFISGTLLAKAYISSIMNIPYETIMANVFNNFDPGTELADLKIFESNLETLDLSALLVNCPQDKIESVSSNYKTIIQSILAERFIAVVQKWCNDKEAWLATQNITTQEAMNEIVINEFPILYSE